MPTFWLRLIMETFLLSSGKLLHRESVTQKLCGRQLKILDLFISRNNLLYFKLSFRKENSHSVRWVKFFNIFHEWHISLKQKAQIFLKRLFCNKRNYFMKEHKFYLGFREFSSLVHRFFKKSWMKPCTVGWK